MNCFCFNNETVWEVLRYEVKICFQRTLNYLFFLTRFDSSWCDPFNQNGGNKYSLWGDICKWPWITGKPKVSMLGHFQVTLECHGHEVGELPCCWKGERASWLVKEERVALHRGTSQGLLGKTRAVLYKQREMADSIMYIISESDTGVQ